MMILHITHLLGAALAMVGGVLAQDGAGTLTCGYYSTGSRKNLLDGYTDLTKKHAGDAVTPAGICRRHWCYNTSAIYVCNNGTTEITMMKRDLADWVERINHDCCGGKSDNGLSGKLEHITEPWGVILGYGNCNHNLDADRPGPGKSNNGPCGMDGWGESAGDGISEGD